MKTKGFFVDDLGKLVDRRMKRNELEIFIFFESFDRKTVAAFIFDEDLGIGDQIDVGAGLQIFLSGMQPADDHVGGLFPGRQDQFCVFEIFDGDLVFCGDRISFFGQDAQRIFSGRSIYSYPEE